MTTLSTARKKAQRFLPLTFKTTLPRKTLDLGEMVDLPPGYYPTNPSILKLPGGGFLVCVRGVNYLLENARTMKPRFTGGNRFHTLNKFFAVSSDFADVRPLPGLDAAFADIEDVKLFEFDGALYGLGSRMVDLAGRMSRMTLGKIASDLRGASFRDIPSPFGLRQEKNWSPFLHEGTIYFLYSYHPLVILKYRADKGDVEFCNPEQASYLPQSLPFLVCGSSPGVQTSTGYLFVAHRRSVRLPDLRRAYFSRLYHLDKRMSEVAGGPYFAIEQPMIQFVNGLIMDERAVYVAYGKNDNSAHLACFDKKEFWKLAPGRQSIAA